MKHSWLVIAFCHSDTFSKWCQTFFGISLLCTHRSSWQIHCRSSCPQFPSDRVSCQRNQNFEVLSENFSISLLLDHMQSFGPVTPPLLTPDALWGQTPGGVFMPQQPVWYSELFSAEWHKSVELLTNLSQLLQNALFVSPIVKKININYRFGLG